MNIVTVAALLLSLTRISAAQNQPLAFEVASVKPYKPGSVSAGGMRPLPGGQTYVAGGMPLRIIIKFMYDITDNQIVGAPSWVDTEFWDIVAKAARPSSRDQLHEMFRTLLADRFKLQFHREMKEMRAYVLSVDKGGLKLRSNDDGQDTFDFPLKSGDGKTVGTRVSMRYLCWVLSQFLNNTPVVDMTGLGGYYDFTLGWVAPPRLPGDPPPAVTFTEGPSLPTALTDDLGLKLESSKTEVEVLVIDHVERPSEN
jgi:uncharacterized protein (TIGR03435 family)